MTKTIIHIVAVIFLLSSCEGKRQSTNSQDIISIGKYSFQFPEDYKLIQEKGIDSYVGKISNGKIEFQFDYGYYSNRLTPHISEYLSEDVLKCNALAYNSLLPRGRDPQYFSNRTELLGYSKIDSNMYQLNLLYEKDTIKYPVEVPVQIAESQIEIDTIDNVIYKYVNGPEYLGLYARDLKSFNKSINSYKALSITINTGNQVDPKEVLKILKTCKYER